MGERVPELHPDGDTSKTVLESRAASKNQSENQTVRKSRDQLKKSRPDQTNEVRTQGGTSTGQPKGVSDAMWLKFQALQNKRMTMTKSSTEARAKEVRKEVLTKVKNQFSDEDFQSLKGYNIPVDETIQPSRKRPHENEIYVEDGSTVKSSESDNDWGSVKKYINVNKHLDGVDRGRNAPKTKLEEKIDSAIARGDYDKAESLSNDLSNRDFGKKIADAFDAKKYSEEKKEKDTFLSERKRKKVAWRFDHKEKWETKGNM